MTQESEAIAHENDDKAAVVMARDVDDRGTTSR